MTAVAPAPAAFAPPATAAPTASRPDPVLMVAQVNEAFRRFAPGYVAPVPGALGRGAHVGGRAGDVLAVFTCGQLDVRRAAGFFVRLHAGGADLIAGCVAPGPEQLGVLHAYIASHHATVRRILYAPAVQRAMGRLRGEVGRALPRDIAPDHPAAGLLRHRQFYFQRSIGTAIVESPRFVPAVVAGFRAVVPAVELLDMALGNL